MAIDRDVNAFSADQQPQIRGLLAESLSGISAQQLVRRADGHGRIAVHEILFSSIALSGLIREAKPQQIPSLMQSRPHRRRIAARRPDRTEHRGDIVGSCAARRAPAS